MEVNEEVEVRECLDVDVDVDADCERPRVAGVLSGIMPKLGSGEVMVAASHDVDIAVVFVRLGTGLDIRVGEARERILVVEQGALQEGHRPSEDGPCNHWTTH